MNIEKGFNGEEMENTKDLKIFISGNTFDPEVGQGLRQKLAQKGINMVLENKQGLLTEEELLEALREKQVYILGGDEKVTTKVIDGASNLKLIVFLGVEPETYFTPDALQKIKDRGIDLEKTPEANSEAVAEMTVGLTLTLMRRINQLAEAMKQGKWENYQGEELQGKIVGILGLGDVGEKVARIMENGFGANVLYWSRHRKKEAEKTLGIVYKPLEEVLAESDIVSLHMALVGPTQNFMDTNKFGLMENGALLINAARPGLVEPQALKTALQNGKLKGAAFDGYYYEGKEFEEKGDPYGLIKLDNFLVTPHQAYNSKEANTKASKKAAEIIENYFVSK